MAVEGLRLGRATTSYVKAPIGATKLVARADLIYQSIGLETMQW